MENKQLYVQPIINKDQETQEAIRYVLNVFDTLRTICERNTYEILNKYDDNEYLSNSMTVDFKYKPNSNDVKKMLAFFKLQKDRTFKRRNIQ